MGTRRNRSAPIHPVKLDAAKLVIPKGSSAKPHWWMVNLGRRLTGTRRCRRFFSSESAATQFIADSLSAAKQRGRSAFDISQKLAIEAIEIAAKLEPFGVTLTTAVEFFIRYNRTAAQACLNDLIPPYLQTKQNPQYRRAQEISLRLFAREYGAKHIALIQPSDIEDWLSGKEWAPLNRRNYIRDLSMFFRWSKLHGYIDANPFDRIKRPKVPQKTPEIYTVAETKSLLDAALAHPDLDMLPMLAFCFFSGVRIAEVQRMTWGMVDWPEAEIRLPGEITKTRQPRNIEVIESLRAWIGPNPPKTGQIVSSYRLRRRRTELWQIAGVTTKRNALRHSFASYHAALHRDPGGLQMLLGQQTPSVLFKHYIAATRRSDAEAYFALRPNIKQPNCGLSVLRVHGAGVQKKHPNHELAA